jgi:hypothetical protein
MDGEGDLVEEGLAASNDVDAIHFQNGMTGGGDWCQHNQESSNRG